VAGPRSRPGAGSGHPGRCERARAGVRSPPDRRRARRGAHPPQVCAQARRSTARRASAHADGDRSGHATRGAGPPRRLPPESRSLDQPRPRAQSPAAPNPRQSPRGLLLGRLQRQRESSADAIDDRLRAAYCGAAMVAKSVAAPVRCPAGQPSAPLFLGARPGRAARKQARRRRQPSPRSRRRRRVPRELDVPAAWQRECSSPFKATERLELPPLFQKFFSRSDQGGRFRGRC
jgi:hypothetical protein